MALCISAHTHHPLIRILGFHGRGSTRTAQHWHGVLKMVTFRFCLRWAVSVVKVMVVLVAKVMAVSVVEVMAVLEATVVMMIHQLP